MCALRNLLLVDRLMVPSRDAIVHMVPYLIIGMLVGASISLLTQAGVRSFGWLASEEPQVASPAPSPPAPDVTPRQTEPDPEVIEVPVASLRQKPRRLDVMAAIRRAGPAVRACARSQGDLGGRGLYWVRFEVRPDGTLQEVAFTRRSARLLKEHGALEGCLLGALRRQRVTPSRRGIAVKAFPLRVYP